jgi:hypothetical protein
MPRIVNPQGVAAAVLAIAASSVPLAQQTGALRVALATVSDSRNRPIVDVDADDFVVQESGKPREILSVHVADYPIVVMIDTGASARGDLPLMQKAVARFIERVGQQRPIALGTFGDPPRMVATFDDERTDLVEHLKALEADEAAESLPMQGAALAADAIAPTGALFSAIVMLSAGAVDDPTERSDAAVTPVMSSGVILHVVANTANRNSPSTGPGSTKPSGGAAPALRTLAEQTHGHFTTIYSAASYQAALEQLANRLATELMVEYLVPNESRAADVKLGVRIPGVRVRGLGVAPR